MQSGASFSVFENIIHRISRWVRLVSQGVLFIMIFLVTTGVIARYVFSRPLKGDMEIQELMMVIIIFLAFPYCQMEKGNVYVEIVASHFKGRVKDFFHSFVYLLGFIMIVLIVWQMGIRSVNGFSHFHRDVTLTLWIPIAPFVLIATIGMGLMGIEWFIELAHSIHRLITGNKTSDDTALADEATEGNAN